LRVLCYQYAGESQSGLGPVGAPQNWRCLAVEKLSDVELLEAPWLDSAQSLAAANLH
jgi:hypothetical protein